MLWGVLMCAETGVHSSKKLSVFLAHRAPPIVLLLTSCYYFIQSQSNISLLYSSYWIKRTSVDSYLITYPYRITFVTRDVANSDNAYYCNKWMSVVCPLTGCFKQFWLFLETVQHWTPVKSCVKTDLKFWNSRTIMVPFVS